MKQYVSILMAILLTNVILGQDVSRDQAVGEFKSLVEKYKTSTLLSFDMLYRYAMEEKPGIYLDTLFGSFKLNGSDYQYSLDSTEVINSSNYLIMMFREDKIMYLSKPSAKTALANPLALMDTFFLKQKQLKYSITQTASMKKIMLDFDPGATCKRIEYDVDLHSGYINRAVYWVKSDQLYDPSVRDRVESGNHYAVVEVFFKNYRRGKFDGSVFDAAKYFKKEGNEYRTVYPYENYKIFLGNPNL